MRDVARRRGSEMKKVNPAAVALYLSVAAIGFFASPANATILDFNWTVSVNGVDVKGMVLGLEDNATSTAVDVIITEVPAPLSFNPLPFSFFTGTGFAGLPLVVDDVFNQWSVSNGVITSAFFISRDELFFTTLQITFVPSQQIENFIIVDNSPAFNSIHGTNFQFIGTVKSVPEPTTLLLLSLGLAGLGFAKRRAP